ncbi:hypothetical protein ABZP36_009368 [Zizania latifolia]
MNPECKERKYYNCKIRTIQSCLNVTEINSTGCADFFLMHKYMDLEIGEKNLLCIKRKSVKFYSIESEKNACQLERLKEDGCTNLFGSFATSSHRRSSVCMSSRFNNSSCVSMSTS